ncbi:phage terminase small subunit P27 family [Kitasatospora sp. NBC_01266]|uniref:phage terminase small subunit P27 family n=1 Tax=Kitasatospora sp. NBC_01266 TaxID=2903572 RepID=UPI002E351A11|nr:phage terminase small subunit P27 family [Kitasatospora sp. NBC_01266]
MAAVPAVEADAPERLGTAGREFWRTATASTSWLATTDTPTLLLTAELIDRRAGFLAQLAETGPVLHTEKGYAYANPLVAMISALEKQLFALLASLGYTPADRSRLGVAEVKAKNAFEEMLARRQRWE